MRGNGFQAVIKAASGLVAMALLLAVSSAGSAPVEREVDREQARAVVRVFLKSAGFKTDSPEFALEDEADEPQLPGFILFDVYYNSANRLTSIGEYAVDRKSAALWERVACERLKSDELQHFQDQLRIQGLSEPNAEGAGVSPCG